jgi:hypothetical protein
VEGGRRTDVVGRRSLAKEPHRHLSEELLRGSLGQVKANLVRPEPLALVGSHAIRTEKVGEEG